jgi:hypothetical protein
MAKFGIGHTDLLVFSIYIQSIETTNLKIFRYIHVYNFQQLFKEKKGQNQPNEIGKIEFKF